MIRQRHFSHCKAVATAFALVVVTLDRAHGDALVVTKAMQASTIAEIFVEQNQIRVELEVGPSDRAAFANIIPKGIDQDDAPITRPLPEQLATFFERDFVLEADGQPLSGEVEQVVSGKRLFRDEVTGDPLINQPNDAEPVVRLSLHYPCAHRLRSLTIRPPRMEGAATANIGFICYHNGLAVNDFRYLSKAATLDLDWDDPWYSRFRHPNLRRQFDAPLSVFLYVEPYEVRKEIIIRPHDLQSWVELELSDDGVISVDQQEELKKRVADFLSKKNPVTIDKQLAEGKLDRIHFVRRSLRTTGIIDPPVELDTTSATLGVIYVYPIDHLPDEVVMNWELFSPKIQAIPGVASDEAGGLPAQVTVEDPLLRWKNYLTDPTSPKMLTVARPPSARRLSLPLLSLLCVGIVGTSLTFAWRCSAWGNGIPRTLLAIAILAAAAGVLATPIARVSVRNPLDKPPIPSKQAAADILSNLLHNVYRSFDHHDERLVYDRLAKSISGDLLSEVYLETRKSVEIKNQGGLQISVKDVTVTELEAMTCDTETLAFRCRWRVSGWIGHWGHVHRRENEHLARITIGAQDGTWKITTLEMLDEQPVVAPSRRPDFQEGQAP